MIIKNKIIPLYFILLISILAYIFYPTFFNAPRSDWWETLYFFHTIYASAEPHAWVHIFNTDCWGHITFRPLSHTILYLQHLIFGSSFIYIHIINFFLYCFSLLLLYRFATLFNNNRILTASFIGLFAFLFSHFDIVSWTAHSYLIFGFCLFLSGFILYIEFLRTGRNIFLFLVSILFLLGMLCYEAFIFWPLSIIILGYGNNMIRGEKMPGAKLRASYLAVIGLVYILYVVIFFLTRSLGTYYDSGVRTYVLFLGLSSIAIIFKSILSVCFNILYNGILINIVPAIACPAWVDFRSSNLKMNIFLREHRPTTLTMLIASAILLSLIIWLIIYLFRRKHFNVLKKFIFFLFLLFSFTFTLFHSKYFSNKEYLYNFQQFRYQYIPNAFVVLIALLFVDHLLKPTKRTKIILFSILAVITISNISHTIPCIGLETRQMAPLNTMLANVKNGIKNGQVNESSKLYIDDNIVNLLPLMCWNPEIGRAYMKRTYQWIFDRKEIRYFSDNPEDASWVIDKNNFGIISNKKR